MTQNAPSLNRFKVGDLIEVIEKIPKEFNTYARILLHCPTIKERVTKHWPEDLSPGKVALILTPPIYLQENEKNNFLVYGRNSGSIITFDVLCEGKRYTATMPRKTYESFIRKLKDDQGAHS